MFRFTIRDLLWLTVVVAMGLGWWAEHRRARTWSSRANAAAMALSIGGETAAWQENGVIILRSEGMVTSFGDTGKTASTDKE